MMIKKNTNKGRHKTGNAVEKYIKNRSGNRRESNQVAIFVSLRGVCVNPAQTNVEHKKYFIIWKRLIHTEVLENVAWFGVGNYSRLLTYEHCSSFQIHNFFLYSVIIS